MVAYALERVVTSLSGFYSQKFFAFLRIFSCVRQRHPPPFGLRARTENFSGRLIKKLNPRSRRVLRARFTKVAVEVRLRSYVAFERERERESRERFLHLFRTPPPREERSNSNRHAEEVFSVALVVHRFEKTRKLSLFSLRCLC